MADFRARQEFQSRQPQINHESKHSGPSALKSIVAGTAAGAIEIAVTYPLEFIKTRTQLQHGTARGQVGLPSFGTIWYAGCTTAIIGNSLKTGVRFISFSEYKRLLSDVDNNISGPRTVIAGMLAGGTESLIVTPFESIKTTCIDDSRLIRPRISGFLSALPIIARERGLRGFFQGFAPTTARQAVNSAVRFSSYTFLKQAAQSYTAPGEKLGLLSTFGIGAAASVCMIYVTQPLDTIKTRMQSIEARSQYNNSFACGGKIVREEGIRALWKGSVPRLARLVVSGGIVFSMYEKGMELMGNSALSEKAI